MRKADAPAKAQSMGYPNNFTKFDRRCILFIGSSHPYQPCGKGILANFGKHRRGCHGGVRGRFAYHGSRIRIPNHDVEKFVQGR